jgi:uncharacterized protein
MLYFDTSFLVPFFLNEQSSGRVERFIRQQPKGEPTISLWTRIEFSSALARQVRLGNLAPESALAIDFEFDSIMAESFVTVSPIAGDFELSKQFLRRYETGLRAGDALHLAIASNHGARAIYSLDRGLLKAGRLLGLPIESGLR